MKALVDTKEKKILLFDENESVFWGFYDDIQASGRAVWKDCPPGVDTQDLVLSANGRIVADTDKIAAREAKEKAKAERRERIASHDADAATTLAGLRVIVRDLLAEIRGE